MATSPYADTLHFPFLASRWLWRYLLVVHLLIVVAIWLVPAGWPLQLLASALVVVSLYFAAERQRRTPLPVITVRGADWQLALTADQEPQPAELLSPVYATRWLMVLPLRVANESHRILVARDSLSADQYRRLRVLVNHRRS